MTDARWVLVPAEPTPEMIEAAASFGGPGNGYSRQRGEEAAASYRHMLTAAGRWFEKEAALKQITGCAAAMVAEDDLLTVKEWQARADQPPATAPAVVQDEPRNVTGLLATMKDTERYRMVREMFARNELGAELHRILRDVRATEAEVDAAVDRLIAVKLEEAK